MFYAALYLLGYGLCRILPRRACYGIACWVADRYSRRSRADWEAVTGNLRAVLGKAEVTRDEVRSVFRNFAMYLVDFFGLGTLTRERALRMVRLDGIDRLRMALRDGKGAIALTAHLGNYELAGAVLSLLGMPIHAVVLSHQNPRVDAFFARQRARVGVQALPIQRIGRKAFLGKALRALGRNELLGLVADRDFFDRGMDCVLFGRNVRVPTGAAAFSWRTGAPIVPCFMVREPDGRYRMAFEPPIRVERSLPREEAIRRATEECLQVMARYIRQYPTQWYMFQEGFWRPGPALIH